MLFKLQPWSGNERLYFYRQSQQLAGQTGQIGKLRADFDRDGNGFFSTWEDIRDHLKTEEFKQTFDKAINALRFGEGLTPLASRKEVIVNSEEGEVTKEKRKMTEVCFQKPGRN